MAYLAIQILGPLAVWDVGDGGIWRELEIKGGAGAAALLGMFVFFPQEIKERKDIALRLWDRVEVEDDLAGCENRVSQHISRLRRQLEPHGAVLTRGKKAPGLTGPGSRTLRVDWHDFVAYQQAGEHGKALSLFDGLPLSEVKDGELDISELQENIREEVEQKVRASLRAEEVPSAETLDLAGPALRQFESHRPDDWRPVLALPPIDSPPTSRTAEQATPRRANRHRPVLCGEFRAGDLFEPCPEGEERLALELQQAEHDAAHTWWSEGKWLGKYFAFWYKMNTRPCDMVAITLTDDIYDGARFDEPDQDAPKDKATIIEAPSFYGDNPHKEITCGLTNWGLAYEWAKTHGDEILAHPSRPSVFGVVGRPVFPGIAGVHTLVQTSDGYVLFGLRAPDIAFHERTWSATFEEQIAVGAREFTGPVEGDQILLHAIEGGLYEEWGIEEDAIELTSCLAIGREWGRSEYRGEPVLNLTATIITACRLTIPLADVWASLDRAETIEDIDEHRAWAAIKFASRADGLRFVASAKGRHDNRNLLEELCSRPDIDAEFARYPRGATAGVRDRGLMPTSAARLVLATGWFETQ
jgi:hypothetical protein